MLNANILTKYNNTNEVYQFTDKTSLKKSLNGNENNLLDGKFKRPLLELAKNITFKGDSLYVQMTTKGGSLGVPTVEIPKNTPGVCGDILPSKIFLANPQSMKPYTNDIQQTSHASIKAETTEEVINTLPADAVENAFFTAGETAPDGLLQYKNPFEEWTKKFALFHK